MTAHLCFFPVTTPASDGAVADGAQFSRLRSGLLALGAVLVLPTFANAQPAVVQAPKAQASVASASTSRKLPGPAVAAISKPAWVDLSPLQQQTLKPLASNWNTLSEAQKRKWLEISKNYHSLPPEGQATMHSRMNEWVALSPQQRAQARLNFAKTKELSKQLSPEEKQAKWQAYQALSAEEKQKLAAKSTARPGGAAPAVKPVSPQKLAAVPPHGVKPEVRVLAKTGTGQVIPAVPPKGDPSKGNQVFVPQQ